MNDPISRDEAVAAVLGTAIEYQLIYGKKEPKEGFVRSLIKRLANIPPEEPAWIPCSERLPKEIGTYLVTLDYKEHGKSVTTLWYHGKQIGWDLLVADVVIAWMPLPEPYKAERKDNV